MSAPIKTQGGKSLQVDEIPGSLFVDFTVGLMFGMSYPDKLEPAAAHLLARQLEAAACAADAARMAKGVTA